MYKQIQRSDNSSQHYRTLLINYKAYENIFRKTIINAIIISISIKETWSLINKSLKNYKKQFKPIEYIINDKCITDHSEITNAFNDYFISSGEKQIMSTDSSFVNYMIK